MAYQMALGDDLTAEQKLALGLSTLKLSAAQVTQANAMAAAYTAQAQGNQEAAQKWLKEAQTASASAAQWAANTDAIASGKATGVDPNTGVPVMTTGGAVLPKLPAAVVKSSSLLIPVLLVSGAVLGLFLYKRNKNKLS